MKCGKTLKISLAMFHKVENLLLSILPLQARSILENKSSPSVSIQSPNSNELLN